MPIQHTAKTCTTTAIMRPRNLLRGGLVAAFLLILATGTTSYSDRRHHSSSNSNDDGARGTEQHRVFPAAKVELYNINDQATLNHAQVDDESSSTLHGSQLGVVVPNNITINIRSSLQDDNKSDDLHFFQVEEFLRPATDRFRQSLMTYLPDFYDEYKVNPSHSELCALDTIDVVVHSTNTTLFHGVQEDYEISILHCGGKKEEANVISLRASTVFGVMHGLETLNQLLNFGWMSYGNRINKNAQFHGDYIIHPIYYIRDIPIYISDRPSYPHRGLMIDTSRHYLPVSLIIDNIDAMAMNKFNVLHWHISDSQSFPLQTPTYPELATKGAYHPQLVYTPNNVTNIVEYARRRGIRVIPEIDMPGHSAAIAKSHPEIMSHCLTPSEPMNPTVDATYQFIEAIYRDLDEMFSDDFVHVGGDEVWMSESCWLNSPSISQWMKDHGMKNETVKLYEYFETKLLSIVGGKLRKVPLVWQEVFNLNLTIPRNTIIDIWKGFDKETLANATKAGYNVILSGCWYLDHLDQTWESFYGCDPSDFTSPRKDLLLGGHASMWGEHVDASNFMSRVWPRASAAAERLWTGNITGSPSATVGERIHSFRCRMVQYGFDAGPIRPGSCPTEVPYRSRRREQRNQITADAVNSGQAFKR